MDNVSFIYTHICVLNCGIFWLKHQKKKDEFLLKVNSISDPKV